MITFIVIAIICVLLLILYFKFFKIPKIKNIVFIDGSLGTGKTAFSVCLAIRLYKKQVRKYNIKKFMLHYIFNFGKNKDKYKTLEKPLLYSNIKLRNIDFVPINKDLLQRQNYRFAYKSVLLIDEISLIVDQMDFDNPVISERLSEFFKLFRHETHGGYCIINSQAVADLHYSLKYVLSDYFYIHSKTRCLGFSVLKIQECKYSSDNSSIQVNTGDIEDTLKLSFMFNKYFKYYDTYCQSIWTDFLPIYNDIVRFGKTDTLKSDNFLSFKKEFDDPDIIKLKLANKKYRCSYITENYKKFKLLKKVGVNNERKQNT